MNKQIKIILCLVMISAIILMLLCSLHFVQLGRELAGNEKQLQESRAKWERIAADKEALQTELKEKQEELKEAELSLSESKEKAEKLRSEIESLQNDINALKKPD